MKILHSELAMTKDQLRKYILTNSKTYVESLRWIIDWYMGNNLTRYKRAVSALRPLIKLWPYTPHNKLVYRTFPLVNRNKSLPKVKVNDVLRCSTAKQTTQSWSESPDAAAKVFRFLSDVWGFDHSNDTQQIVGQLMSPGHELANTPYLIDVVNSILALFSDDTSKIAISLTDFSRQALTVLSDYRWQKEVIMLLPEESKIRVVKVLNVKL